MIDRRILGGFNCSKFVGFGFYSSQQGIVGMGAGTKISELDSSERVPRLFLESTLLLFEAKSARTT